MALILGIESSCDETAAAIVDTAAPTLARRILAQHIASQDEAHRPYGGVVPEIAARAHVEKIAPLIAATLADAGLELADMDAIAATAGPGLIGGVMVGLVTAKALAMAGDKPLLAVNHLEGHALSPRLADPTLRYPYCLLLVSGGHCQVLEVRGVGDYRRLATTIDDALGEAFDKTAKLLGLGYPGGPAVAALAEKGRAGAVTLPRPMKDSGDLAMSFSGLKTAVLGATRREPLTEARKADIARGFEEAVVDVLCCKAVAALDATGHRRLVVAGGVGANRALRARLVAATAAQGAQVYFPDLAFCTDNGAMIALVGALRLAAGPVAGDYAFGVRPRWELASLGLPGAAEPVRV